jgi:NurA-like 5'-3' nuclease
MWRLSDELLQKFRSELEKNREKIEEIVENSELEWREIGESKRDLKVYGVDGSRGTERRSGVIIYAVSGVAVGDRIYQIHELTSLRPYKHIDDRIRLHMLLTEFRTGAVIEDADLVLMDGTLSGAIIRPPAYLTEKSYKDLNRIYDLESLLGDFLDVLERWWEEIVNCVRDNRVKGEYLLTRTEYFERLEAGCRKGNEKNIQDLTILFEYVEYLHALEKLLQNQNAIFIAKNFYTSEITKRADISDASVLDFLSIKQFGYEKAGYTSFKPKISKSLPAFVKSFQNVWSAEIHSAFVRFLDGKNIYLLESNKKIDDDIIAAIKNLQVDGYPVPLIHAHRYAEISIREFRNMITGLLNAISLERYGFMLKKGRDALE